MRTRVVQYFCIIYNSIFRKTYLSSFKRVESSLTYQFELSLLFGVAKAKR